MQNVIVLLPNVSADGPFTIRKWQFKPAVDPYISKEKHGKEVLISIGNKIYKQFSGNGPFLYAVRRFHSLNFDLIQQDLSGVLTALRYVSMGPGKNWQITHQNFMPICLSGSGLSGTEKDWAFFDALVDLRYSEPLHVNLKEHERTQLPQLPRISRIRLSFSTSDFDIINKLLRKRSVIKNSPKTRVLTSFEWYARSRAHRLAIDERERFLCLVAAFNQLLNPASHKKEDLIKKLSLYIRPFSKIEDWFSEFWEVRHRIISGEQIMRQPGKRCSGPEKLKSFWYGSKEGRAEYLHHINIGDNIFRICADKILGLDSKWMTKLRLQMESNKLTDDEERLEKIENLLNRTEDLVELHKSGAFIEMEGMHGLSRLGSLCRADRVALKISRLLLKHIPLERLNKVKAQLEFITNNRLKRCPSQTADIYTSLFSGFNEVRSLPHDEKGLLIMGPHEIEALISGAEKFFELFWRELLAWESEKRWRKSQLIAKKKC